MRLIWLLTVADRICGPKVLWILNLYVSSGVKLRETCLRAKESLGENTLQNGENPVDMKQTHCHLAKLSRH